MTAEEEKGVSGEPPAEEPAAKKRKLPGKGKAAARKAPAAKKAAAEEPAEAQGPPVAEERAVGKERAAGRKPVAGKDGAPGKGPVAGKEGAAGKAPAGGKERGAGKAPAAAKEPAESKRRLPGRKGESTHKAPRRRVVRAHARYVRTSARKARMVCGHLRGKSVQEARAILAFTPRDVARDWSKLLESAVANAESNHELLEDDLIVREAYADEGPTIKRFRPRAMGRAAPIRKRTSHLTITLTPDLAPNTTKRQS
jgi:ribosomal protein L22